MQRTFINNVLRYLKQIPLPNIFGINFLFITHSPFILSDIPSKNILRIKNGSIDNDKPFTETFGSKYS